MWTPRRLLDAFYEREAALQKRHDDLLTNVLTLTHQVGELQGEKSMLERANAQLATTNEWMRVQVNALTMERSSLMERVAGVRPITPEIVMTESPRQRGIPSTGDMFSDPEEEGRSRAETAEILHSRGFMNTDVLRKVTTS